MRLLDCSTLQLQEFYGTSTPRYAILSHRWEDAEATYQDVGDEQATSQKPGWVKIRETCRVALGKGDRYIWVDTCCINKQDFTELTGAINSMFKWYARSSICYVYLSDVGAGELSQINESLWFTRGWTLQELIAPSKVEFYDKEWNFIGTRAQLWETIQRRTKIHKTVLEYQPDQQHLEAGIRELLSDIPVAARMSWASGRTTSREEDRAYSLMGIFGVNMPLLYGEGEGAFMRLQEEIIKQTNDMTLFAWTCSPKTAHGMRGILATSPDEFQNLHDVVLTMDTKFNPEYTITNKGLRITAEATLTKSKMWVLSLGCRSKQGTGTMGILLFDYGGGVFLRSQPEGLIAVRRAPAHMRLEKTLYIKKHIDTSYRAMVQADAEVSADIAGPVSTAEFLSRGACRFHINPAMNHRITRAVPENMFNYTQNMFLTESMFTFEGYIKCVISYEQSMSGDFVVACGRTPDSGWWYCLAEKSGRTSAVYNAATFGNLDEVRRLGVELGNRSMSQRTPGLSSRASIANDGGFDIFVELRPLASCVCN